MWITFSNQLQKAYGTTYAPRRVRIVIQDECIRDRRNCICATMPEELMAEVVICVIAKLAHRKDAKFIFQNCSGKSIKNTLIPKIKKVKSSACSFTFINEDSYHLSFYNYQCNVCFYNRELQEYRIYLDLQNIYEDLRKAVGADPMPFTFDELLIWARPLVMVIDHRNKTPETMEVHQNEWKAQGLVRIAPLHRFFEINKLKRKLEMLTEASDDTTVQTIDLEMEITMLESETLEERTQRPKANATAKASEEAQRVAKTAEHDRKRAEKKRAEKEAKEAQHVAQRVAKAAAKAAKESAEEAQRAAKAAAKAAEHDAKWTAEVDATLERMVGDGYNYSEIASELSNGLKKHDINNRWNRHSKESSGITKPPLKTQSRITWTADIDTTIVEMRVEDISFAKIASELGNGLKKNDIKNRWNRHLKDKLQ
jgi:flagellar biosynthesis GTPase FlhF